MGPGVVTRPGARRRVSCWEEGTGATRDLSETPRLAPRRPGGPVLPHVCRREGSGALSSPVPCPGHRTPTTTTGDGLDRPGTSTPRSPEGLSPNDPAEREDFQLEVKPNWTFPRPSFPRTSRLRTAPEQWVHGVGKWVQTVARARREERRGFEDPGSRRERGRLGPAVSESAQAG